MYSTSRRFLNEKRVQMQSFSFVWTFNYMHTNYRGRTLTHTHARAHAHRHGCRRACMDADEQARTQTKMHGADARTKTRAHGCTRSSLTPHANAGERRCECVPCVGDLIVWTRLGVGRTHKDLRDVLYMLGTDLKPAASFKAVQTYLKPSGRVKISPESFKAVGANKCGYKAVQQAGC